jgi:hypothetical protein
LACSLAQSLAGLRIVTACSLFFLLGVFPFSTKRMVVLLAPNFSSFHGGIGTPK